MDRKKVYWLCQIIGWTGYTLADMVIYLLRDGYSTGIVFNALLTVVFGIAITHLYRLLIKRLRWSSLPLPQIVVRTLVSVPMLALVMVLISVPLDYFTVPSMRNRILDIGGVPVLFLAYYFLTWSKNLLLWSVIYHMYHYFSLGKKAEIERVQLESSVKDFEVKILRAQLNPHFMFKTVQDYLSLEKIRYEDRLNVQTNISPDTLNVQVPPMMVQTLVENAVKHGISKPIRGGFISIDAQLDCNFLNLTIRNTGKLETKPDHDGVGMLNTAQRLALIYGEGATFRLNQETDEVVRAEVRLPVQA